MTTHIGLVGVGFIGRGIAACFLGHGYELTVYDSNLNEQTKSEIDLYLHELVDLANFPRSIVENWQSRWHVANSPGDFASCDFLIESVAENIDVKLSVFAELEKVIGPTVP